MRPKAKNRVNARRWNPKKIIGVAGAIMLISAGFSPPLERIAVWPSHLMIPQGEPLSLPWSGYLPVQVTPIGRMQIQESKGLNQVTLVATKPGHYDVRFSFLGKFWYRTIPVDVTAAPPSLVPGGESLGVVAHTRGLVVTAVQPIRQGHQWIDPAQEAGIERGDIITRINQEPALTDQQLQNAVRAAGSTGKPLELAVEGARTMHRRWLHPVWVPQIRRWEVGVVVEDGANGVGTLTFYNPKTHQYAALGHSITDGLTRHPVAIRSGYVMGADIVGVIAGSGTIPGQKIGVLAGGHNVAGNVMHNGRFGIVGRLAHNPVWGPQRAIPLALPDQVQPGAAQIVTVVRGQRPEVFQVRILRTYPQWQPNTKGLLFQVTDPRLLRAAGGVVQGMSGSPIIENGHLVGAVTHVLLSRPALGFGCYAYWMAHQPAYSKDQNGSLKNV